jgi:hypothetical protein
MTERRPHKSLETTLRYIYTRHYSALSVFPPLSTRPDEIARVALDRATRAADANLDAGALL